MARCFPGAVAYDALQERFLRPILPRPGADTETVADVLDAARREPVEA